MRRFAGPSTGRFEELLEGVVTDPPAAEALVMRLSDRRKHAVERHD